MSELRLLGRHALSVLAGQLAVMAFGVADTVIAGRHSAEALAALSVGSAIYISVYVALIGVIQALLPIWAEMRGARRERELGASVRQAMYLVACLTLLGMVVLLAPGPLLSWAQVPETMRSQVEDYLSVLAMALFPALAFRMYSTLNQALGRPLLVTGLQLAALAVKVPLSIWWVGGGWGLPALGAAGCAWATLAVNYLLLALALLMLRTSALYHPYQLWRWMEAPDLRQLRLFLRQGLPGGLAYMVEVTSFTLMAVFIARMGTTAAASHQVAASVTAVLYMVPLSLAIATSARVSYWIGRGDAVQARRLVGLGMGLGLACASSLALLLVLLHEQVALWYTGQADAAAAAAPLLLWVAAYHLADALQALSGFLLRCWRVTLLPLVIYGLMLWGLGLTGGYWLAYEGASLGPWIIEARASAASFWVAATGALSLVAACLMLLLWHHVRRGLPGWRVNPN